MPSIPHPGKELWRGYEHIAAEAISPENRFFAAVQSGHNTFLSGMAGTGKTTLLKQLIAESGRNLDITAPTGVAALNAGGMTLHRFCGMLLGPKPGQSNEEYFAILRKDWRLNPAWERVRSCRVLVIDEISMLPGRQLEFVEFLFRRLRGRHTPFGGCQVIAIGDFLQLPPVRTAETEPYDWAFQSSAWDAAEFQPIILETVRRQDEPAFVAALGQVRVGNVRGEPAKLLQGRVKNFPPANMTRLCTHNRQVDRWNDFQLAEIQGDEIVFEAETSGPDQQVQFLVKNLLTPATLRLKPGALVSFTVNKSEPGRTFVNGQLGTVEELGERLIKVRVTDGATVDVQPFRWLYDPQDDASASFTQFPLRLAWAMTIHKAQGLTLDAAYVDVREAREPGQVYVAMSRVRTLAGLYLKDWFKGVHVSPEAVRFYEGLS